MVINIKEHEILQWLLQREKVLLEERSKIEKRIETVHNLCEEFEHMILTNDFDDNTDPVEKVCENEDSEECSCSDIDKQIDEAKIQLELAENNTQNNEEDLIQNNGEAFINNIDEEDIIGGEVQDALTDLENEWKASGDLLPEKEEQELNPKEEKIITKKDTKNIEKVIDIEKYKKKRAA